MNQSNRSRFEASLAGARVDPPVYAVYDWFAENRPQVDWARLFQLGLGRINHATLTRHVRPHVKIGETTSVQSAGPARRDVTWITDIGELHEWYLGEWRQEYLIKTPADYRIMARALADVAVQPAADVFQQSEAAVGDNGRHKEASSYMLGCPFPVNETTSPSPRVADNEGQTHEWRRAYGT